MKYFFKYEIVKNIDYFGFWDFKKYRIGIEDSIKEAKSLIYSKSKKGETYVIFELRYKENKYIDEYIKTYNIESYDFIETKKGNVFIDNKNNEIFRVNCVDFISI